MHYQTLDWTTGEQTAGDRFRSVVVIVSLSSLWLLSRVHSFFGICVYFHVHCSSRCLQSWN